MIVRPWRLGDSEAINLQTAQRYTGELGDVSMDLTPLSEVGLAWTAEAGGEVEVGATRFSNAMTSITIVYVVLLVSVIVVAVVLPWYTAVPHPILVPQDRGSR